jgi:predicted glycoside hydrolase/deacetylase ChbG (UPF0249 family)
MAETTRPLVICADDYAHTAPISRAILDLAATGRISALSCMTASHLWPEHGRWLADLGGKADVGLHLTLVDEAPLTKMPKTAPGGRLPDISTLIAHSYLGQLDIAEIEGELVAQIDAFQQVTGHAPHHIDGHLHTHVLPGIRDLVLKHARGMTPQPWLRNVSDALRTIVRRGIAVPKAVFLSTLGHRLSRADNVRMNASFSGLYGFSPAERDYATLFERFLQNVTPRHLILCHPGEDGDGAAHSQARAAEYAFFKSTVFPDMLAKHVRRVGRFAELPQ